MRYLPKRVRQNRNLAIFLRCCPHCLGDLEFRSDASGEYYTCLQCNERADPAERWGRLGSLASPESAKLPLRGYVAS